MTVFNEMVKFRLLHTPCCGALLCWVNPRLPSFCPECGKHILIALRQNPECTLVNDEEAWLQTHAKVKV